MLGKISLCFITLLVVHELSFFSGFAKNPEDDKHPSTPSERLKSKLKKAVPATNDGLPVKWSPARPFTPKSLVFLTQPSAMHPLRLDENDNTTVLVFRKGTESQGVVRADDRSLGGSVTGKIATATKRKAEKKSTFIQYDRDRLKTQGKDFPVKAKNYRGRVNYDGGHLIDHKYSAQGSHTDPRNYVPQHYFYNSPLKEYLVQDCDEFVEISLYTPNPPSIGVKGRPQAFDEIPIGIIFIQIVKGTVKDAYFFPNNDYDYEAVKKNLGLKKGGFAKKIAPLFRLKKSLHRLLVPACLYDIDADPLASTQQKKQEESSFASVDDLVLGISLAECDDDEDELSKIGFDIIQQQKASPLDFLDINKQELGKIEQAGLQQPLDELGKFLIYYALRNGLKSEVLSTHSRLVFINLVIDFFEAYHQVSEEALGFVDEMETEFKRSLQELTAIASTMNREELLFLANTYRRLADPSIDDFSAQDHSVYESGDNFAYLQRLIHVLNILNQKVENQNLDDATLFNLIDLHTDAQNCVAYLVTIGYPEEEVEDARLFLEKSKPQVKKWFKESSKSNTDRGVDHSYVSGVNRSSHTRTSMGYLQQEIEFLGTHQSSFYP